MNKVYTNLRRRFSTYGKFTLVSLLISFVCSNASAQSATEANVSGTSSVINISNNTATAVDPNLVLTANGNITGFTVSITGSYTSGDVLAYTGTLPSGITAAAFNTTTRSLVFSGTTTPANWQALIRTVTLTTTSAVCNPESRLISFVVGIKYYNILNGHFYEYYSTGQSWTNAKAYAAGLSYFGREGYLATIGAQSENSFSYVLVGQNSWIGCSDNYLQINAALGYSLYANQSAADGNFYWVVGPERGTKISGQNTWGVGGVLPVSGVYNNWAAAEPNDHNGYTAATPGQEDYGHMYTGSGIWNDFPNTSSIGSIIEFGGMPNDNTTSKVVFTRSVFINGAPSGTITGGNVSVCSGLNSTTLTLTGLAGTVVRWESSLDNFLTAGLNIVNTTTTLTVSNISTTTYYRAIVNTPSGCSNLATSSTPLYVISTVAGNIIAANNSICAGANADFTIFGNSGNVVKWQVSTVVNFSSSVTDINTTASNMTYNLATNGTYYFRAQVQNPGCGSAVYTPGYTITVITGTAPVGGSVSSSQHCGGAANTGTLTLSGHTGTIQKWQLSVDGGIIWTDVVNTATTYSYTGVSANRLYRAVLVNGTCGTAYSASGAITVFGTTITRWDGTISSDWSNASNWCGGIADNGKDMIISASASNHLVLDQNRLIGRLNFNASGRTVTIGNFDLTAASFVGYNSSNYIITTGSGKVKVNISNAGSTVFPVGFSAYNPLTVTNNTGSADVISARIFDEVYLSGTTGYTASMGRVKRTWDIGKASVNCGGGLDFVFGWNGGETYNLIAPALYHYEGGSWNLQSGTTSSNATSLTYTGYTGTFSPFAIGNGLVPLPVNLLSFDVLPKPLSNSVLLNWKTLSEIGLKSFEILRSSDGVQWNSIGEVKSQGNNQSAYQFTDNNPGALNYYRLKIYDVEGNSALFVIKKVDFNADLSDIIKIYPNPSKSDVEIISSEPALYSIIDVNGRVIQEGEVNGKTELNKLSPGIYLVRTVVGIQTYSVKLVIE